MEKRMDETMDAEKFLKELIRRALLGDQEAQKECTEKGIKLYCPICGKSDCIEIMDCYTAEGLDCECQDYRKNSFKCICNYLKGGCGTSTGVSRTEKEALEKWNTRQAPPIGRCGECKAKEKATVNDKGFLICPASGMEIANNDFCSYFEPREE